MTLKRNGAAAGSRYYYLTFTNASSGTCSIQAFPGVSYVAGDNGHQVGQAAIRDGAAGPPVTLQAGQSAAAQLQEVVVANFPASLCGPAPVRGLRVYPPDETHSVYVPQAGVSACSKDLHDQHQLGVETVKRR